MPDLPTYLTEVLTTVVVGSAGYVIRLLQGKAKRLSWSALSLKVARFVAATWARGMKARRLSPQEQERLWHSTHGSTKSCAGSSSLADIAARQKLCELEAELWSLASARDRDRSEIERLRRVVGELEKQLGWVDDMARTDPYAIEVDWDWSNE
jgi:hypothetical protein